MLDCKVRGEARLRHNERSRQNRRRPEQDRFNDAIAALTVIGLAAYGTVTLAIEVAKWIVKL